jgi:hypothetical protein
MRRPAPEATTPTEPAHGVLDDAGAQLLRGFPVQGDGDGDAGPYRMLVLDPAGQLVRFFYLDCASADEAMACAQRLAAGRPLEVWRSGALVGRCGPSVQ